MTRDEAIGLFDEWQARMAQRDATGLAQLYAPDCIVNSPIFGELKGRAAVEASNRRLYEAFPDWDMRTDGEVMVDGDRLAMVFNVTATHAGEFMGLPGTGRKAQIHGARIMRFENGLIKEELRLYDFTLLLMQVGVLRGKPGH